jgi:microcystin-dependent protein
MSEPFLGEIRPFAFGFTPNGWLPCEGQVLSIAQNQALFALLGITYGGNGTTTFALPDLRGRTPLHVSPSHPLGQAAGEANHTLQISELPAHTHNVMGSTGAPTTGSPVGAVWATRSENAYSVNGDGQMSAQAIATVGAGQTHNNMQPYLPVNYCIAVQGIFPPRN